MKFIIDGCNLLWAFPSLRELMRTGQKASARDAMTALLAALIRSGRLKPPVTVVFDGKASTAQPAEGLPEGLHVRYAPHPTNADDVIREMVESSAEPGDITVVSSDGAVRSCILRLGAHVLRTAEFIERHVPPEVVRPKPDERRKEKPEDAPQKPSPPASDLEIETWLREFGLED